MAFIYGASIVLIMLMTALALYILPSPFVGGVRGVFSMLWYLCALAAALGYWHKVDLVRLEKKAQQTLQQAKRNRDKKRAFVHKPQAN